MAASILTSIKKMLGIGEDYEAFDLEIIAYINSAFATLNQMGIGPEDGFEIEDKVPTWVAFLGEDPRLNPVKPYTYFRVRLIFDPPTTSFLLEAMKQQIEELAVRLSYKREEEEWTEPIPA